MASTASSRVSTRKPVTRCSMSSGIEPRLNHDAVAYPRATHGDRTDAGHDLALR
jgi:hypothetical protein